MFGAYFSLTKLFSDSNALDSIKNSNVVNLFWWKGDNNFGDEINPLLISRISGKETLPNYDLEKPNLLAIGSVLNFANGRSIVWGSGLLKPRKLFKVAPACIKSVRGHLTKKIMNDNGFKVKNVGDLGLIVPDYFLRDNFVVERRYKVGIIPHYVDKSSSFTTTLSKDENVLIIDIQSSIDKVISGILSCDVIFSSSLHGVIISDAYGVEAHWVKLSNAVVGGGFKFHDYFSSVSRPLEDAIQVDESCSIKSLMSLRRNYKLDIDKSQIYDANPFI